MQEVWESFFKPNGKFDKQITIVVAKSNRMVGWSLWTFRTRTKEIMLTILKALAVPQVEHGCIIWMSTSQNSVNLIESIQGRFAKIIDFFQSYDDNLQIPITTRSYHKRPKMLNIYGLKR